jgi:hypothetical protein
MRFIIKQKAVSLNETREDELKARQEYLKSDKFLRKIKGDFEFRYKERLEDPRTANTYKKILERTIKYTPAFISAMIPGDIPANEKLVALNWVIKRVLQHDIEFTDEWYEAARNIRQALSYFFEYKNLNLIKGQYADLNNIPSLQNKYSQDEQGNRQTQLGLWGVVTATFPAYNNYMGTQEVFFQNNDWQVIIPHNKAAACKIGKKTSWCTSKPDQEHFEHYYKPDDPLFIFKSKHDPNVMYQFHYGSLEFKDIRNNDVDDVTKEKLHNVLLNVPNIHIKYPIVTDTDIEADLSELEESKKIKKKTFRLVVRGK